MSDIIANQPSKNVSDKGNAEEGSNTSKYCEESSRTLETEGNVRNTTCNHAEVIQSNVGEIVSKIIASSKEKGKGKIKIEIEISDA